MSRLGLAFEGQASVPGLGAGIKKPAYVLFPDENDLQAAEQAQGT